MLSKLTIAVHFKPRPGLDERKKAILYPSTLNMTGSFKVSSRIFCSGERNKYHEPNIMISSYYRKSQLLMLILPTAQSYLFIKWNCQQLLKQFHDNEYRLHSFLFTLRVDLTQPSQNLNKSFAIMVLLGRPQTRSQLALALFSFYVDTEKNNQPV